MPARDAAETTQTARPAAPAPAPHCAAPADSPSATPPQTARGESSPSAPAAAPPGHRPRCHRATPQRHIDGITLQRVDLLLARAGDEVEVDVGMRRAIRPHDLGKPAQSRGI